MTEDTTQPSPKRQRREPKRLTEVQTMLRIEQLMDSLPVGGRHRLATYLFDRYAPVPALSALPGPTYNAPADRFRADHFSNEG